MPVKGIQIPSNSYPRLNQNQQTADEKYLRTNRLANPFAA